MKIAVKVTVEITPDQAAQLAVSYGLGDGEKVTPAEIRQFAKDYIQEQVQGAYESQHWSATVA